MARRKSSPQQDSLDLGKELGASDQTSAQIITLYIPNKDKNGLEFGTQRKWVLEAAEILARIGGGVTIMLPVEGGWVDPLGSIVWEHPIIVYSFIKPEVFIESLPALRRFLHRLGRETNQGEIAVEFDGWFYRLTDFDKER